VCSRRNTTETSIARQRLDRHIPASKNKNENIGGNVGYGDPYSVLPGVIKRGHVTDSTVIQLEENSEGSSVVEFSVHMWSVNQRTKEPEEVTDS
jgi:hypothetical protein